MPGVLAGNRGRPGVPPGVYFRMPMVGYLEGLGSERGNLGRGDTASLPVTLDEAERQMAAVGLEAKEVVADKGYHSNKTMTDVKSGSSEAT